MSAKLKGFIALSLFGIFVIFQLGWYLVILKPIVKNSNEFVDTVLSVTVKEQKKNSKEAPLNFNETRYISGERRNKDPFKKNAFNSSASDRLASNRPIPDVRDALCREQVFSKSLPSTSVIICFHNEARSTLLRTVVSVLNRSPPNLIHEIILVDDFSDDPNDGLLLESIPKVKVLRNNEREGLVRSRIKGADYATAPVLTFLDSHCECNVGWLEPLLQRVMEDPHVVVCPIIDIIDFNKFTYKSITALQKGVFDWALHFNWGRVDYKRRKSAIEPVRTPTIAGGLFAINRLRFIETGKYDPEMDIWGGENIEMSFRTWMCGGSMEILPCSRVGHVFRLRHPYKLPSDAFIKNTKRTAEIWMDEYKQLFYAARPYSKTQDVGSIEDRLALRKKLNCSSFDWYVNNVYPELAIPNHRSALLGLIRQQIRCMESVKYHTGQKVGLYTCSETNGNQIWMVTTDKTIRNPGQNLCLHGKDREIFLYACSGSQHQVWEVASGNDKTTIKHVVTGYCVTSSDHLELVLTQCDSKSVKQQWMMPFQTLNDFL